LPVNINAGGRLRVNSGGYMLLSSGGSLTVSGTLEVQPGGRLRSDYGSAFSAVTVSSGAQLTGTGTMRFDSSSQLSMAADAELTIRLEMNGSSAVIGSRVLIFRGNNILSGNYQAPVEFASDAVVDVYNATLQSNGVIRAGALLAQNSDNYYTLTINGVLTNNGTLRMVSRYLYSTLNGAGWIENAGLIDTVVGVGGMNDNEAQVRLSVNINDGGLLREGVKPRNLNEPCYG